MEIKLNNNFYLQRFFQPSFVRFLSPRRRRQYFHVNTSKSSERRETIALLREEERCGSHLLFTCFLVLSLTSGCGVSVKRRRCDHSAINASVKTSRRAARNRRLLRVAASQRLFVPAKGEPQLVKRRRAALIGIPTKRKHARKQGSWNLMIAAVLLHLVGKDAKKELRNRRKCGGSRRCRVCCPRW